jgi:hypothetical protein
VRVPLVQSREVDENDDGLIDRLELNLQTPLKSGETIYAASAFVFMEYRVRTALGQGNAEKETPVSCRTGEGGQGRGKRPGSSTVVGCAERVSKVVSHLGTISI